MQKTQINWQTEHRQALIWRLWWGVQRQCEESDNVLSD